MRDTHRRLVVARICAAAGRAVDEVLRVGGVGDERLELSSVLGGGKAAEEGEDDGVDWDAIDQLMADLDFTIPSPAP